MTVLTASAALDATAFGTLLNINASATPNLVNVHLLQLSAPPYRYDIGGTFTNILNLDANHVTSITVWYTPPVPDQKLYVMSGFNVTVGQVKLANTAVKL